MHLKINLIFLFISIVLISCSIESNKEIVKSFLEKKDTITKEEFNKEEHKKYNKKEPKKVKKDSKELKSEKLKKLKASIPIYFIGESYFIEGIEYSPKEDYSYNETGLASYYGPELHLKKTVNNEYNKVTELLARHKTLPLPSIVKITNLENGLSLILRVNDRGPQNNARIIEVSRKVAQLLRFYKSKITKVRLEILSDSSKQLKIVTQSISNPDFDKTLEAIPTEIVTITDLGGSIDNPNTTTKSEQPIELGFEEVSRSDLFIKIAGFNSYQDTQNVKDIIQETYEITIQKENEGYSIILGPMLNQDADNLFQILVSKGYKQSEIIIK